MPAYNFQKQFAPMILSGRKLHTIRKHRKQPTKVGDILWLYTGMRTKECKLIAGSLCTRVEPIVILPFLERCISNIEFSNVQLAHGDGFDNLSEFFAFFRNTYKSPVLVDFEIIFWDTKRMISSEDFVRYLSRDDGAKDSVKKMQAIADWEERRKR